MQSKLYAGSFTVVSLSLSSGLDDIQLHGPIYKISQRVIVKTDMLVNSYAHFLCLST